MSSFLATLVYGCAALLGTAVMVAAWEHWRHGRQAKLPPTPAPVPAQVDIDLAQTESPQVGNDQAQRQTAVDSTLARMSKPAPATPPGAAQAPWIETHPMVTLGPIVQPQGAADAPSRDDIANRTSEPH